MNIIKHLDFFNPYDVKEPIHVIGVGAIGSTVVEQLVRLGFEKIIIYDLDRVSEHNLANQMFEFNDIGEWKTTAVEQMCKRINPDVKLTIFNKGYVPQHTRPPKGYVFLCVDNIDLRRTIVQENLYNNMITGMFDFRMGLTDAQHYATKWDDMETRKRFLDTMQFTHEEAAAATPVSACGTSLSVVPTVRMIVSMGMANFINMVKKEHTYKMILVDAFHGICDCF